MLIFTVGSFWFWSLLSVACIVLLFEVAFEHWALAAFTIAGTLCALEFFGGVALASWVVSNPLLFLGGCLAYLGIGVGWAFVKWYLFVTKEYSKYKENREAFFRANGHKDMLNIPQELRVDWARKNSIIYNSQYTDRQALAKAAATAVPSAGKNKSRIMQWLAYWPWSMLWSLLDDFLRELYERIYMLIVGTLQNISNRIFADVKKDFEYVPPPEKIPPNEPTIQLGS